MELFKITCVTCRARLSVRDAALIGQIIGCPRCGMMVQVTPPADAAPVAPLAVAAVPAVASTELPKPADAIASGDQQAAPPPAQQAVETNPSIFDVAEAEFDAADVAASPAPTSVAAAAPAAAISGWGAYKFTTMLIAAAIAGSVVVGAAISWLRQDPVAAATSEVNPTTTPSAVAADIKEQSQVDARAEVPGSEEEVDDILKPSQAEAFLPVEPADEGALDDAAETAPTIAAAEAAPPDAAKTSDKLAPPADEPAAPAVSSPPADQEPQPRLRIDPLDVDPEGLNLSSLYAGPPKDPLAESQLPAEEPANSIPAEEPSDAPADAPPVHEAVRREEQAGDGAAAAVEPLLARRLPVVSVAKAPLCRFLDLAVQLSGLPVSADPNELRMAAVTAATPVSADVKDATIEQLLTTALAPLRLKPVIEGQHVLLKRTGEDARRAVAYPVEDLAKTPEKVTRLAEWVTQLAAPNAWTQSGGDATLTADSNKLRIDAAVSVQYEVLFVLERYRLASGLPTRTKYPSDLLNAGSTHAALAERLGAPAQFTFSQYAPLREVFRFWQEELEVAVLVDWPALADERLWPQSRIACGAADQPWAEAMDSVLQPLGLGWRAVDRRTIEITTLAKVNAEPQFAAYRVRPGASADGRQLATRIHALSGGEDEAQAAAGTVIFDSDSRVLLVRQPAAVHRRIVTELNDVLELDAGGLAAR